ncbi:hypothetical protein B0H63DRAFT_183692 [Podospora didyma]|uniref:Uncharacterized protein n=1 Tax=Podospora didyma TaxID=330526 RepID=A0AAE0NQ57_9PEZI|nr:hypothetical protein B0H63DRAFT_183692 [Podospora didyma]
MAEAVAGAIAAEQIVATLAEAAAAVAVAQPTQPPKVSLTQLAKPSGEDAKDEGLMLARSGHTATVIGNTAWIFGGEGPDGFFCPADMIAVSLPAAEKTTSAADASTPSTATTYTRHDVTGIKPTRRTQHAACSRADRYIIIHGGKNMDGEAIFEDEVWMFDTVNLKWIVIPSATQIGTIMEARYGHHIFVDPKQDLLILHGGHPNREIVWDGEAGWYDYRKKTKDAADGSSGSSSSEYPVFKAINTVAETWMFDLEARAWTQLPPSPASGPPVAAALVDSTLYSINYETNIGGKIHWLYLHQSATERERPDALVWHTAAFPANPFHPGPRPRKDAALLPLKTGMGRQYLVFMFGCSPAGYKEPEGFMADIWALQLPSTGVSAAAAKDAIRDKLPGMESGKLTWSEVEVIPTEQIGTGGKAHPGGRCFFGADSCYDGKGIVMLGGLNRWSEKEADGWILRLAYGYSDDNRFE